MSPRETFYSRIESPLGPIHCLATENGLGALYFETQSAAMDRRFPQKNRRGGRGKICLLRAEAFLSCYFSGDIGYIPEVELDLDGTSFQREVWAALLSIPPSQTRTYGEIAKALGRPEASRAVGAAVGQNPVSILIPCHRVVGAGGKLTGYAGGLDRKRYLLDHEARNAV
jgi:methylated-DNA-[protein]-cysteine S-methyltransferase